MWQWFVLVQHELLLFAGIFFLLGALDDLALDGIYLWARLTGRARSRRVGRGQFESRELAGRAAIFIPAWQEASVIGGTIAHLRASWPQAELRLYVGCYRNDPATISAVMEAARGDDRVRLVIHDRDGPTTKADCLNRLYQALRCDEARSGDKARMVVFHDAEDVVDPAALAVLDAAMDEADFVQLPVLPLPQEDSRFLGSHYCEEFAEAHGKAMVVRDLLGASVPSAGVGCAIGRAALARLASERGGDAPFAADSITEDYELGLAVGGADGRTRFLRLRGDDDRLIATRAYFPAKLPDIVRQKTRWVHGIAFQSWDRLGWSRYPAEAWMRLRDRRGPLAALVLLAGYVLLTLSTLGWALSLAGWGKPLELTPFLAAILWANLVALLVRVGWRFAFAAREYGLREAGMALVRLPLANIIAIMAGRRALAAYWRTLRGEAIVWEKTPHVVHPPRPVLKAGAA